ncbi:serine protease snake isoform X1 [Drosophila navojoa]|uniref:serine protease snake isoform X1 n=1 Tax=Drosophila navojoa TaxID=7232 RepID=UPI0008468BFA|nr:serine protease snake isoform X1 [Drosophila navojoa]
MWIRRALLLLALLPIHLSLGQINDIVRKSLSSTACTSYKKSVFEEQVGYSFLFPNAPVMYETIDNCLSYTPLIVGGQPADPKEFPHMARLGHRSEWERQKIEWFCGGTLISDRFVLTAAHCFESEQGELNVVRLGDLDFENDQEDASPRNYDVANYYRHPQFISPELYNDIGMVKLAERVLFDRYKHPACLPFESGQNMPSFIAVGWGSTNLAGKSSARLLKVKLNNIADDVCRRVIGRSDDYPRGFEPVTQMCVGSSRAMDTCSGDSGGPILVYHKEYPCMYHVMGITSAGIACGTPRIPSIYTRVYNYLDWITHIMANF